MRDRQACGTRLRLASQLAAKIRERTREQTGFAATVFPLLSKMATVEKPDATNMLHPWQWADLICSIPLRKLQGVGSRTVRALDKSLERHAPHQAPGMNFGKFGSCLGTIGFL
jgi:nucleotidyltransferase/DNA polymerase involved in DNA repair